MTENRHEWEKEFYRNFVLKQNGDKEEVGFWSTSEEKAFHNAKRIIDFIAAEKVRSAEEERGKIKQFCVAITSDNKIPDAVLMNEMKRGLIEKIVKEGGILWYRDEEKLQATINVYIDSLISNNITE